MNEEISKYIDMNKYLEYYLTSFIPYEYLSKDRYIYKNNLYKFMHPLIWDYIIDKCIYVKSMYNELHNIQINIYNDNDFIDDIYYKEIIDIISFTKKHLFNNDKLSLSFIKLNITLYLTPFNKCLSFFKSNKFINDVIKDNIDTDDNIIYNKNEISKCIDILCINSGCSYKDNINDINNIFIWRKEEWQKVLIHELIHAYKKEYIYNTDINEFDNIKYVSNNYPKHEAELHTEIKTYLIYSLYNSNKLCKDIKLIINDEIEYSLRNLKKIIKFYNINDIRDLLNNKVIINVKSSLLYYVILKSIILYNIKDLIDINKLYNENIILFKNNKLYDIYIKTINDNKFIEYINNIDIHMDMNIFKFHKY